jgi:hypothetical protein
MHDVAVNKISLTNPNIDINKWYKGFKEDYEINFVILEKFQKASNEFKIYIANDILNLNTEFFPQLAEMKIVLEKIRNTTNLNALNEMIKMFDVDNMKGFYEIYNSYKKVYEGIM